MFGSIFYESVLIWNSFWKLDFYRAEVSKELGLSAEPNCRLIRCRFPRFSQTQPPLKPDDKYSELPTLLPNETDSFKFINLEFLLVFLDEESILFLSRAIAIEFSSGTCRLERLLSLCRCGAISGVTARGRFWLLLKSYLSLFDHFRILIHRCINYWHSFHFPFRCSIDAAQQQMALNFELVVSNKLFSVVLAAYKWFKISAPGVRGRHMWQLDKFQKI